MTREEYIGKHYSTEAFYAELDKKKALLKQLLDDYYSPQAKSESLSSGGGSKSRTDFEIKEKWTRICNLRREIQEYESAVGLAANPNAPTFVESRFE